ncbi:MAG: putative sulfate exporter family transporter [Dehalococcoidia bacterium]|nr:putative sulfate exporter family transporter [Dehalococcoidia bacterium]
MTILFNNKFLKGFMLCLVIAIIAIFIQKLLQRNFTKNIVDQLLIAMIIGFFIKQQFSLKNFTSGINFSSKYILEIGIILLGFSMNFTHIMSNGLSLLFLILFATLLSFALILLFARKIFNISSNLSILLATGNSICGNSAIVAIAPILKATPSEIGIAISFSAICGAIQIIIFPLLFPLTSLSLYQYGIIVGISVYSIPQVIAASFAVNNISGMIATQVKLIRILFLGPLALLISYIKHQDVGLRRENMPTARIFLPWFIIGFIIAVIIANTINIPDILLAYLKNISSFFFIIALAAIGLKIELSEIQKIAWQVIIVVIFANILLLTISFIGINLLELT